MKKNSQLLSWILQIIVAGIILSTVPAKFIGIDASKELFSSINLEPNGRYIIGSIELIACILLLYKNSVAYGASLTAGVMAGATIGHLTTIGFKGDLAIMAALAILSMILSFIILYLRRTELPVVGRMFGDSHEE